MTTTPSISNGPRADFLDLLQRHAADAEQLCTDDATLDPTTRAERWTRLAASLTDTTMFAQTLARAVREFAHHTQTR